MLHKAISQQIIQLSKNDITLRTTLLKTGALNNGYNETMEALHIQNATALEVIIDKIGYPTTKKVGSEASEAAWLIIQHAISRPKFMKKCLVLLSQSVQTGEANPLHEAYLSDRIAVFENRPQLYGTQFDWDANGLMSPNLLATLEEVNTRRKALGLNSITEQTEVMRQQVLLENQLPPSNIEKHWQSYDAWRRKVGWL